MAEPFSVLLPVYHGDNSAHLSRAIASAVTEQELKPDELVLVMDGPLGSELDATVAAATKELPVRTVMVQLPKNVGLARALDAGLQRCAHEIVARADADDISLPQRFAVQIPLMDHGLDIVGSAIQEFDEDELFAGLVRTPPLEQGEIARYARFHDPFNHPSVVFRKSVVQRAGGYRHLDLLEDYWLFARMIAAGAMTANCPEPLVLYRVGAGSYARRGGLRLLRSEWRLQREFRRSGFTTTKEYLRNVVMRCGYRLVPESVRRIAYRSLIVRSKR